MNNAQQTIEKLLSGIQGQPGCKIKDGFLGSQYGPDDTSSSLSSRESARSFHLSEISYNQDGLTGTCNHWKDTKLSPQTSIIESMKQYIFELHKNMAEKDLQHKLSLEEKREEISAMHSEFAAKFEEMKKKHEKIENAAPKLQSQLHSAKQALKFTHVSQEQYQDILKVPADMRDLSDSVKVAVYTNLEEVRKDNEMLSATLSSTQAACLRFEKEAATAEARAAKAEQMLAIELEKYEALTKSMKAHSVRLQQNLDDSLIETEISNAKAGEYDQGMNYSDKMRKDTERVHQHPFLISDASVGASTETKDVHNLKAVIQGLEAEKACLTGEVSQLTMKCDKLEGCNACLSSKIEKLESSRNKGDDNREVIKNHLDNRDQWISHELKSLHSTLNAGLEQIRTQCMDEYQLEARAFGSFRDNVELAISHAQSEIEQPQIKQKGEQDLKEKQDRNAAEAIDQLRVKKHELLQIQADLQKEQNTAQHFKGLSEMLQEQVDVMTDRYHTLHSEMSQRILSLQADKNKTKFELLHDRLVDTSSSIFLSQDKGMDKAMVPINSIGTINSNSRDAALLHLSAQCQQSEIEKEDLLSRIAQLEATLQRATVDTPVQTACRIVSHHQRANLDDLLKTKMYLSLSEERVQLLESLIQRRDCEADIMKNEHSALRADLERVLQQQSGINAIQCLVESVLARMRAP